MTPQNGKGLFKEALRWIGSLVVSIVGPFVLLLVGVVVAVLGGVKGWDWMVTGGVVIAAVGVIAFLDLSGMRD